MGIEKHLRRLSSSFTAPKINISYDTSQRFCFSPVISSNNLNDCEDDRSTEFKHGMKPEHTVCKPESKLSIELETKIY